MFKEELEALLQGSAVVLDDVSKLVGKHFVPKEEFNKVNENLKSKMTEKEKSDLEANEAKQRLTELESSYNQKLQELKIKENNLEVEKIFQQAGLTQDDYKDLLPNVVTDDLEKSKNVANQFVSILSKTKETTKNDTTNTLLNTTPTPTGTENANGGNKELEKITFDGQEYEIGNLI